jgi:hypothetical protein
MKPGRVSLAIALTWTGLGLSAALTALLVAFVRSAGDAAVAGAAESAAGRPGGWAGIFAGFTTALVVGVLVAWLLAVVPTVVFAVAAGRGAGWARIALAVLTGFFALFHASGVGTLLWWARTPADVRAGMNEHGRPLPMILLQLACCALAATVTALLLTAAASRWNDRGTVSAGPRRTGGTATPRRP